MISRRKILQFLGSIPLLSAIPALSQDKGEYLTANWDAKYYIQNDGWTCIVESETDQNNGDTLEHEIRN